MNRSSRLIAIAGIVAMWGCVQGSLAGQPGFHSGGQFHPLERSDTEFVVEFPETAELPTAKQALRGVLDGTLTSLTDAAAGGRVSLLQLDGSQPGTGARALALDSDVTMRPVYRDERTGRLFMSSGRIVTRLQPDLDAADRDRFFRDYQVRVVGVVGGLSDTFVVEPFGGPADADMATAQAMYGDTRTMYAHCDFRVSADLKQIATFDPFSDKQWYLQNDQQSGGQAGADISIDRAWPRTRGANTLIGMLDDGIDVEHEDLISNYRAPSHDISTNTQSDLGAAPQGNDRHGTAVAGIMVAERNNNLGVTGVAPLAQFTASRGLTSAVTLTQIASAFSFARNQGVDVHNNSWGLGAGTPNPDVIVDAIRTAFDEGRNGLGMVVVFAAGSGAGRVASDPAGQEVSAGEELATLDTVIGVGASNANDEVASYSNYGVNIDVLAPSNDFVAEDDDALPAVVTVDNTDGVFENDGYNAGGFSADDNTIADLADANYTRTFGGTSAAAPQVSALAALVISVNPDLTANGVRNIIEHTCDQIAAETAAYNGITSRSLRYGYGRINAATAVEATFDDFVWPERVADVSVDAESSTIFWAKNEDIRNDGRGVPTASVLVVESSSPFEWTPDDPFGYAVGEVVAEPGVTVVADLDVEQYTFDVSAGKKYFGLYSTTFTPRNGLTYGFGVSVDSDGTIIDSGVSLADSGGDGSLPPASERPRLTIDVRPTRGISPLTVSFTGNAQTSSTIESFQWDFGDGVTVDNRIAEHTYVVNEGQQRFVARLTAIDAEGRIGERSVAIDVTAADDVGNGGLIEQPPAVAISISDPNSVGSDITSGVAPLTVVLNAELSGGTGPLDDVQVTWDLGDGNVETSLSAFHTYRLTGTFPVTVDVTLAEDRGTIRSTRFLTVLSNGLDRDPGGQDPGDGGTPDTGNCGLGLGLLIMPLSLLMLQRRRRGLL